MRLRQYIRRCSARCSVRVAHGLRELPNVKLKRRPRMADFAMWITACEPELELKCSFDDAYSANREHKQLKRL